MLLHEIHILKQYVTTTCRLQELHICAKGWYVHTTYYWSKIMYHRFKKFFSPEVLVCWRSWKVLSRGNWLSADFADMLWHSLILGRTFPSLNSFSSCDVVTAGMDCTADNFVWVCLPNGGFHPRERSSILVLARPPKRKCCRPWWFAEFHNCQMYSHSWVLLRLAIVLMTLVTKGYNCYHIHHLWGLLPPLLPEYWMGSAVNFLLCTKPVWKCWVIGIVIKSDNI